MKYLVIWSIALLLAFSFGNAMAGDLSGTLSWECPAERQNGDGYDCNTELGIFTVYSNGMPVWTGLEYSLVVNVPDTQTHNYTVTVTDISGQESEHSTGVVIVASPPMRPIVIYTCNNCIFN